MRLDLNAEPKHTALPMRQGCEIDADGDFEVPRSSRQPHEEKYEETWILIGKGLYALSILFIHSLNSI